MSNLKIAIATALLFVAHPALADKFYAVTPSGAAEMIFPESPAAVIGKITSRCIDSKWTVISSTNTELVCEAPMNFGQSLLGQMLMGNSYSTPPRRFFRFNVAEVSHISRVQASGWMELQMAFGQMKRTDFSGPEFHNGMINFLSAAGGNFPLGTTFPNHVTMGVTGDFIPVGKAVGLRVTKVEAQSAAAVAGIVEGDVIVTLAGKKFKDGPSYLDAAAKAAEAAEYRVGINRNEKPIQFTLARAFRSAWSQAVVPAAEPAISVTATASPISVADELSKLQKLKEQGVLTQAEFDLQKSKLLGQ